MVKQYKAKSYLLNRVKLFTIEVLLILTAFLCALFIVVFFIKRIFFLKKEVFDFRVFEQLSHYVTPGLTSVMRAITLLGSQYFLIPAYLILIFYFLYIKKDKWLGLKIASVSITSLLIMFALKLFFKRPRPLVPLLKEVEGLSFPSGHAFMSFSFFGLLIYVIHKELKNRTLKAFLIAFLLVVMMLVGLSRVYLRVHYASDVIVGFCMGFMWMVISLLILHFVEKNKMKLPEVQHPSVLTST